MSEFFEKFRIYKKEGRVLVSEGSSPLRISKILSNTAVATGEYILVSVYTINGKEIELSEVDIPAFKTGLIAPDVYSIGSSYVTGKYEGISPTKIALIVNDEKQQTVKLSEELTSKKQFRYYKQGLKASDRVKVVLYDESLELGTSDVVIQSVYSMSMTANEMKAKLDEKNIEYKTSDTKETLLSLLQKNE
ncbi:hypothetical protein P6Y11_11460 [Enterococcus faecalis]|uniref:immunoglobulin-like domain-containing protein n=1 Tax=Enterococcus faecalis TaxID=1351 RepID=UPI0019270C99|nr:immunoglobulin-like domain-containing protein [Enterococcus faecalis]MDG0921355.1 hypothetical protein [Enterococcus faecalis]HBD0694747.1 hypothetical protein [Enterococcus faecalis]HBD0698068.1 hypothetical protein [Enterococcus faecalis]HBD0710576.1 hypothetical protein [Enterococcus faecalis]HBD0801936.1 hypothetical protein [Enterococcus faecalis]